ncbi:DUF4111 domain-containing protein [Priestia filamentosa]|uniref:nucleotidyltransferase domain-containing protein n=1 Tax=Priestia filamentosa TaxID=1402861 RepID=UPI001FB28691|nr:nucleotidyltransferase domain-containing protein [Priestia filamentosa]UOE58278.1 DUF4111 domain-containing protein [Priestia filamentosa]
MDKRIPPTVAPLLDHYVKQLKSNFPEPLIEGVYLYGSLGLNAFNEKKSDIDFITILKKELDKKEIKQLKSIHHRLNSYKLGNRMEGSYIYIEDLGKNDSELKPYPYCVNGKIKVGKWDVNEITWWSLENDGINIYGTPFSELNLVSTWDRIMANMEYNMKHYWINKTKHKVLFLFDDMVEFCILTVSRILITLETKTILSKDRALEKTQKLLPQQWELILMEGKRLRSNSNSSSFYSSRISRANECIRFVLFTNDFCNKYYFNKGFNQ